MCYLIAKKFDKEGSLVLEVEQGRRLASLSKYLTLTILERGGQIVTLNNLESLCTCCGHRGIPILKKTIKISFGMD